MTLVADIPHGPRPRHIDGRADHDLRGLAYQCADMAVIAHDLDRQLTRARLLVMLAAALGGGLGVVIADMIFPALVAAQLAAGQ